jgi:hypothetical protein
MENVAGPGCPANRFYLCLGLTVAAAVPRQSRTGRQKNVVLRHPLALVNSTLFPTR